MKLTDLKIGAFGDIQQVSLPRLGELGLIRGVRVQVISRGPFGNPIEIAYCGNHLLIDRRTASEIGVNPCD